MFNPVPATDTALYLQVDSHHVSFISYIFLMLVNSSKSEIKTEQCECVL